MNEQIKLKNRISQQEFLAILKDIKSDFEISMNNSIIGDKILIKYRGVLISPFNRYSLPMEDVFDTDGTVIERGYRHILSRIHNRWQQGQLSLDDKGRQLLVSLLMRLDQFENPVDFMKIQTMEDKDIVSTNKYLERNGVSVKSGFSTNTL